MLIKQLRDSLEAPIIGFDFQYEKNIYDVQVRLQQLSEIEEIVKFKKFQREVGSPFMKTIKREGELK